MKKINFFKICLLLSLSLATVAFTSCEKNEPSTNPTENLDDPNKPDNPDNPNIPIDPNNLKEGQIYIKFYPSAYEGSTDVVTFSCVAESATVDWGDGTVETFKNMNNHYSHGYGDGINKEREILITTSGLTIFGGWVYNNNLTSGYVSAESWKCKEIRFGNCPDLYFINIEQCSDDLKILDVSKVTSLKRLNCSKNNLTALDVTKNTNLEMLACAYNPLTNLDLSNNPKLDILICWSNQLTSLDLSNNSALTYLELTDNKLSTLDISNNGLLTTVKCSGNQFSKSAMIDLFQSLPNNSVIPYYAVSLERAIAPVRDGTEKWVDMSDNPGNCWNPYEPFANHYLTIGWQCSGISYTCF